MGKKRGQITLFMILGVMLLLVFIFLIVFSTSLRKEQITQEKENIVTKAFKKEAFRIYIDDCLTDELEKGLLLLGKQGTLWDDQPGGRKAFANFNGIWYGNDRVMYGLTRTTYPQYEHAFPCENESNAPEFCQYSYPRPAKFGELKLSLDSIEDDLRRYLINRTVWCIQNFTLINISRTAELESAKMDLQLEMNDQGIKVNVEYPLQIRLGKKEYFHLSTFDFFYPTKFKRLVEATVVKPLEFDWKFVDFNYTRQTLESPPSFRYGSNVGGADCEPEEPYFRCHRSLLYDSYRDLSIEMINHTLLNGDEILIFKSPFSNIVQIPGEYEFRIARQNRPPALNYVNRSQCIVSDDPENSYDYLVIPDKEGYNRINIKASAIDPDEDVVKYQFITSDNPKDAALNLYRERKEPNEYFVEPSNIAKLPRGLYHLQAIAEDPFGLQDRQDIRMLIDRPLITAFSLSLPYKIWSSGEDAGKLKEYNDIFYQGDYYWVSKEDPVFLQVKLPEPSAIPGQAEATISYISPNAEPQTASLTSQYQTGATQFNFNLPWPKEKLSTHSIDDYSVDQLKNWPNQRFDFNFFHELAENAQLRVDFNFNYCGYNSLQSSFQADIMVKECIPHINPTHPHPYIPGKEYHNIKINDGGTETNEPINPFLASHVCCNSDWTVKKKGESCFQSPEPTCETAPGGLIPGYILSQKIWACDGQRGNICGAGGANVALWKGELRCGDKDKYPSCAKTIKECSDALAWGYLDNANGNNGGWCHGEMGCQNLCSSEVVNKLGLASPTSIFDINDRAKNNAWTKDEDFVCGCNGQESKPCDKNFDGIFAGTCQEGICQGDS